MTRDLLKLLSPRLSPSFRLLHEMPGGGMSRLFLAEDHALGRKVVVKVLPPELCTGTSIARFRHEIELTVHLQHPHILPILSAGGNDGLLFYVSPYIEGESLRHRLDREGPLDANAAHTILTQLASALSFAHSRGVIHRDVKPGNVLLLDGNAILADFGVAKALGRGESLTTTDVRPGTPAYLAPEQPQDASADLYALAVVGWELLTGRRPQGKISVRRAVTERARHISDTREQGRIVRRITRALTIALHRDPARRFRSVGQFGEALERDGGYRQLSSTSARPRLAFTAIAILLATGVGLTAYQWRARSAPDLSDALQALSRWDLPASYAALRAIAETRPVNAAAQLALARVAFYQGDDSLMDVGRQAARQAVLNRSQLPPADQQIAQALSLLFDGQYVKACESFGQIVEDRGGFDAWFGFGECRRRDHAVVPAANTRTGYGFRGGYDAAATAYERALRLIPPPHPSFPYRRLGQVLPIETARLRSGQDTAGHVTFRAYPELLDDTLAYQPYPVMPSVARTLPVPPGRMAALERNMFRLRRAYASWIRMSPRSAEAFQSFAHVLETMGDIAESGVEDITALAAIRRARALARDTSLGLINDEVRLLLKDDRVEEARALADSALARWRDPSVEIAGWVAPLAALTGHVDVVEQTLRDLSSTSRFAPRLNGTPLVLAPELRRARAQLMTLGTMGICGDAMRMLATSIAEAVQVNFADSAQRAMTRDALLARPLALAMPCEGTSAIASIADRSDLLVRAGHALHARGRDGLQAFLDTIAEARRHTRLADVTLDQAFGEASLLVMAGDTTQALRRIEGALAGLTLATPTSMTEVSVVAGLVRLWMLGAKLSQARGLEDQARRWALNAAAAWQNADARLQPAVEEMRAIAGRGNPTAANQR